MSSLVRITRRVSFSRFPIHRASLATTPKDRQWGGRDRRPTFWQSENTRNEPKWERAPSRQTQARVQDVQHHVVTTRELISKEEGWTVHDMRRVERCFKHFSYHPNPSQEEAVRQLWERARSHVTSEMYSHAIQALAKHGHMDCAKQALCEFVETHTQVSGIQHKPTASHLNAVLQGYAHNRQPEQAEALLRTSFASTKWMTPNAFSVTHVLDAWSRVGNGERAQALLDWVESSGTVELNLVCYNAALTAWARSQDGGHQAEALLHRMPMAPDAISWSAVLTAWASSARQPQGTQRAEELLWKAYGSGHSVDQSCFNTLLHAFGRQGQVNRAEHMLKQWIEMVVTGGSSTKLAPDLVSFNIILNAIAKSGREEAGRQAQTVYEKMLEIGVAPDIITFNSLLNAWAECAVARSALNSRHGEKDSIVETSVTKNESDDVGHRAQAVFDDMITRGLIPDSTTYNSLLKVFAKHGYARKAQKLLDRMERDERNGQRRSAFVTNQRLVAYNTVLNAWVKSGRMHNNDDVGLVEAAVRTQAMLQRMRKHEVRPNEISYAAVLNSLENCGGPESAEVAERILKDMEKDGVKPKKVHYATVIDMWINSGDPERAFQLVKKMESTIIRMDATGLLLHPAVYVSIISAYARRREPERAEAVLMYMENCETAPSATMAAYLATLTAWANSDDPEKARRAWQILKKMHSKVDEKRRNRVIAILRDAHNTVISACASLPLPATKSLVHEATEIAIQVFNGTPKRDDDTDQIMIQSMRHLMSDPNELDKLMRWIKNRTDSEHSTLFVLPARTADDGSNWLT